LPWILVFGYWSHQVVGGRKAEAGFDDGMHEWLAYRLALCRQTNEATTMLNELAERGVVR
jgi:hypothetical protein